MQALFNIRGKMIVVETDSSISVDTVKVRSLDSFAALLQELDTESTVVAIGKSGPTIVKKRRRRKSEKATARRKNEIAQIEELHLPNVQPTPDVGWRDSRGRKIILNSYGVTRIEVAQAINEKSALLADYQLKLLGMRYGIGTFDRPHSTEEVATAIFPRLNGISAQAKVSDEVSIALKRLGFRLTHRRRSNGTHKAAASV